MKAVSTAFFRFHKPALEGWFLDGTRMSWSAFQRAFPRFEGRLSAIDGTAESALKRAPDFVAAVCCTSAEALAYPNRETPLKRGH